MRLKTSSVDWSGNYEENCIRLGKILGTSRIRRKLFNTIYGRGTKPRSRKQLVVDAGLRPADGQQAQNELDVLASCGLIHREKNDGLVNDRSTWVYSKDPDVRAHRKDIVKFADKPALAKKTATKRNPIVRGSTIVVNRTVVTRQALKRRKHIDVLYLMANPIRKHSLRVDAEIKAVNAEVRRSKFRDNITLQQSPAADYDDVLHGLNDHNPRIVHFSGHGNSGGVAMDGGGSKRVKAKFVTFELLGRALAATDTPPDVVVLNACDSAGARKALLGTVKAIIGMEDSITDVAAVAFATKFYGAIASGQSLQAAYDQGCAAVAAVSLDEASTPTLNTASGVNAKKLVLA
jgi:hypothetical protein